MFELGSNTPGICPVFFCLRACSCMASGNPVSSATTTISGVRSQSLVIWLANLVTASTFKPSPFLVTVRNNPLKSGGSYSSLYARSDASPSDAFFKIRLNSFSVIDRVSPEVLSLALRNGFLADCAKDVSVVAAACFLRGLPSSTVSRWASKDSMFCNTPNFAIASLRCFGRVFSSSES